MCKLCKRTGSQLSSIFFNGKKLSQLVNNYDGKLFLVITCLFSVSSAFSLNHWTRERQWETTATGGRYTQLIFMERSYEGPSFLVSGGTGLDSICIEISHFRVPLQCQWQSWVRKERTNKLYFKSTQSLAIWAKRPWHVLFDSKGDNLGQWMVQSLEMPLRRAS